MNLDLAEARYQGAVRRALNRAQSGILNFCSADLSLIDATAFRQRDAWNGQPWDWERELARIANDPRRFSLAIWHGEILCGLALGQSFKKWTACICNTN
jgi:hypothetical protein